MVTRPAAAVSVLSEIPQYSSTGLKEFLASLSTDPLTPANTGRQELTAQVIPIQEEKSIPSPVESNSPGIRASTIHSHSSELVGSQEDPALKHQLLLEHSRTIMTILASADATSKQIFNQVD
jgi:hypothetical protein